MELRVETIGDKTYVLEGIGRMFYQDGYPIPMAVNNCREKGWTVSYLHLAKELLNEWTPKTVVAKLKGEFQDTIEGDEKPDFELIEKFCNSEWEDRCEMIFQYLFGYTTDDIRSGEKPIPEFIKSKFQQAI